MRFRCHADASRQRHLCSVMLVFNRRRESRDWARFRMAQIDVLQSTRSSMYLRKRGQLIVAQQGCEDV
jgi:hypothetical protein